MPSCTDPHGHAALLLVESLIHGLCSNATLSPCGAIEIAERAVEVQFDHAVATDNGGGVMWQSHALLLSIAASLRTDGQGGTPPARLT
jgi:hypothetical protein